MNHRETGMSRRKFFDLAAGVAGGALAAGKLRAEATPNAPKGANDKVRIGLIGSGNRGREVSGLFVGNLPDVSYVAACDPYKMRLEQGIKMLTDGQKGVKVDSYDDYRKILDRKDIDAVHIATPDHWHCQIMIDAIAAGKDVYVEKPLSNTLERAVAGLKAYKAAPGRIVQIGTQQRSGTNWIEAAKIGTGWRAGKGMRMRFCNFRGLVTALRRKRLRRCRKGWTGTNFKGPLRGMSSRKGGCGGVGGGTMAAA